MISRKTEDRNRYAGLIFSLAGILALALALRLWGIGFGFPYAYHFDEPTFVRTALDLGAGVIGSQPATTGFPNILFCEYAACFMLGRVGGVFAPATGIGGMWPADPNAFFILVGRLTSGLLGALSVLIVYRLGRETHGRAAGWLAALFLAVAFLHVRDSHYAVPDATVTLLLTLTVLLSVLALRQRAWKYLYLAGTTAGYAIATKWTIWPVSIPLAMATFYGLRTVDRPGSQSNVRRALFAIRHLALFSGSFLGGLLAGGFQLVLKPAFYRDYALYEWQSGREGGFWAWQVDTVPGWLFYMKTLSYGLGAVLLGLALAGFLRRLYMVVRTGDRISLVLVSFPLPYLLLMSATRHYFARYALPVVPFCALFGAEAILFTSTWAGTRQANWKWPLTVMLALAALAQPLAWSVRHDVLLTRQDTRTLAKQWIEAHIPAGAKIAVDWPVYGPPLSKEIYDLKTLSGIGLAKHPIEWYQEQGFHYLIASSFVYNTRLLDSAMDDTRRAFYAALDERLELVQEFSPGQGGIEPPFIFDELYGPAISLWQRERPGPVIKIYRLP